MNTRTLLWAVALSTLSLTTATSCTQSPNGKLGEELSILGTDKDDLRNSEKWGNVEEKQIQVRDFDRIQASGNVKIYFTQGNDCHVTVKANHKVFEYLTVNSEKGELNVHSQNGNLRPIPVAIVYVSAPRLTAIHGMGATDIKLKQPVTLDSDLELKVSGACDIDIKTLKCKKLSIALSGAGDIDMDKVTAQTADLNLSGAGDIDVKSMDLTGNANLNVSGSGDIDAMLSCNTLKVTVNGAGDAEIDVKANTIEATANGTGDIELEGRTRRLVKRESGLGSIRTKKLSAEKIEM